MRRPVARRWPGRPWVRLVPTLVLVVLLAGCGDTGPSSTTNTQGGAGRAPGAPPADRSQGDRAPASGQQTATGTTPTAAPTAAR